MVWQIALFILSLVCLWFAASVVLETVSMLSKRFHISEFWVSFFVLGSAMSIPEVAVGINSIVFDLPEVLVGDELGSSLGIFLLIIPVLAVLTGGISLKNKVTDTKLKMSLAMVILPFLLMVDGKFSKFDSLASMLVYVFLMIYFAMTAKRESFSKSVRDEVALRKSKFGLEVTELIFGALVIFLASNAMVESFKVIVDGVGGSRLGISLILMSLGTSVPEVLVVFRSAVSGKKEMAFGGYLGSAVANSFMLAVLSMIYGDVNLGRQTYFRWLFGLFLAGLTMLYLFVKSKDDLSRKEGAVLIMFYVAVVILTASV